MSLLRESMNPKLGFSQGELIAYGVEVHPIQFERNCCSPPFNATYFHVLPGCQTPEDQHSEQETWIVLQGQGILKYEYASYPITQNDIFYFDTFKKHQLINNSDKTLIICSIYW